MFIKLFIISLVMVTFVMLALGIKILIDPKAEFTLHDSCDSDEGVLNKKEGCSQCQIKDLANCEDDKIKAIKV